MNSTSSQTHVRNKLFYTIAAVCLISFTQLTTANAALKPHELSEHHAGYSFRFPNSFQQLAQKVEFNSLSHKIVFLSLPSNQPITLNDEAKQAFMQAIGGSNLTPMPKNVAVSTVGKFLKEEHYERRRKSDLSSSLIGAKLPDIYYNQPNLACRLTGFRFKIFNARDIPVASIHLCAAKPTNTVHRYWVVFDQGYAIGIGSVNINELKKIELFNLASSLKVRQPLPPFNPPRLTSKPR